MFLKATDIPLEPGDRVFIHTGGGGGYGSPDQREIQSVANDVQKGYVTVDVARDIYRVVFDDTLKVDLKATNNLRQRGAI